MLGTPCRAPELITSANYCLAGKIGVGWGTEIPRIFYTKLINIDEIEMRDGKPSGLLCLTEVPVCTVQITVHPSVWPPHTRTSVIFPLSFLKVKLQPSQSSSCLGL